MRSLCTLTAAMLLTGCTFNFEVTSQRTALENQVLGSYKELEDDLVLVSAVRGRKSADARVSSYKRPALDALQNQSFNRDDIDELKDLGLIGETARGEVALMRGQSEAAKAVKPETLKLAEQLVKEENRDREVIWRRIIDSNENLSLKDMPEVRKTYAKRQAEAAASGHWLQDESGRWFRKAQDAR